MHSVNLSEINKASLVLIATGLITLLIVRMYKRYKLGAERRRIERIAVAVYRMHRNMIVTDFRFFPVHAADFKMVDLRFYDAARSCLESLEFSLVGDFEEAHIRKVFPQVNSFYRIMIRKDGAIRANIYNLNLNSGSSRTIELLTEFSTGAVLMTSNNPSNGRIDYPDGFSVNVFETDSVEELLQLHQQKIVQTTGTVRTVHNLDEIVTQNKRIKQRENQFRRNIGREAIIGEFRRMSRRNINEKILSQIAERVIALKTADSEN